MQIRALVRRRAGFSRPHACVRGYDLLLLFLCLCVPVDSLASMHACIHQFIHLTPVHLCSHQAHLYLPPSLYVCKDVCVCVCVSVCALYVRVHKYVCACTHVHLSGPVSNHQASIYTGRCGTDDVAAAVGAAIFRPPAHLAPLLASALQLLPGHVVALQVFPPHAHARSACHSILHGRAVPFCIGVHAERLEARLASPVCWRVRV